MCTFQPRLRSRRRWPKASLYKGLASDILRRQGDASGFDLYESKKRTTDRFLKPERTHFASV